HTTRLLRKAKTDSLNIECLGRTCETAELQFLSSLITGISYKKMNVCLYCTHTCSDVFTFFPSLMEDRNLEDVQIRLSLKSNQAAFDITQTREMLKKLSKFDKFRMDWTARSPS
ncbi:hypothetical protein PMAYCL1PPCAC_12010, partial [Pristionchus mayeri]